MGLNDYKKQRIERLKKEIKQALTEHYKEEVFFEILVTIPILYSGWECDQENYVVATSKGEKLYINSDHGSLYVDLEFDKHIDYRLKDYKESEEAMKKAKELLKK